MISQVTIFEDEDAYKHGLFSVGLIDSCNYTIKSGINRSKMYAVMYPNTTVIIDKGFDLYSGEEINIWTVYGKNSFFYLKFASGVILRSANKPKDIFETTKYKSVTLVAVEYDEYLIMSLIEYEDRGW